MNTEGITGSNYRTGMGFLESPPTGAGELVN